MDLFLAPAQHKPGRPAGPGERADGEAQAAGGRGRLGAELRRKHAGWTHKISPNLEHSEVVFVPEV